MSCEIVAYYFYVKDTQRICGTGRRTDRLLGLIKWAASKAEGALRATRMAVDAAVKRARRFFFRDALSVGALCS